MSWDFNVPDLTEVPRDSPTRSAQAEAVILQYVTSNKWMLVLGDIKTTFLSGDEEHHNIFILDDVRDILKLRVNGEQSCLYMVS